MGATLFHIWDSWSINNSVSYRKLFYRGHLQSRSRSRTFRQYIVLVPVVNFCRILILVRFEKEGVDERRFARVCAAKDVDFRSVLLSLAEVTLPFLKDFEYLLHTGGFLGGSQAYVPHDIITNFGFNLLFDPLLQLLDLERMGNRIDFIYND